MKEVYSYSEIAPGIAEGETVTFCLPVSIYVTARRASAACETITATIEFGMGGEVIATCTSEFADMDRLLSVFDIPDHVELFEVMGGP
ncbi:MAG TPA: hypothetical protein VIZ18_12705 [Ktedonobacteraceae bacterium]